MSAYSSYVIRIYQKKGEETLVGQIMEFPSGRKRSFATMSELQSAVSRMLRPVGVKPKKQYEKKRREVQRERTDTT